MVALPPGLLSSGRRVGESGTRARLTRPALLAPPAGRPVPRVQGLLEEVFRLVGPELGHGRVGVDDGVLELAALPLYPANVDVLDGVAVGVELDRPARGVGDLGFPERGQEGRLLLYVAIHGARRLVDPATAGIAGLGEVGRHLVEAPAVLRHELPVHR